MAMLGLRFDLRVPEFATTTHPRQYATALEMADWADRTGLDMVILSEHHGAPDGYLPAPLTLAAAVLGRTPRIGVNVAAVAGSDPYQKGDGGWCSFAARELGSA